MAKIAVKPEPPIPAQSSGAPAASPSAGLLAQGQGWSVYDVVCNAGPQDRAFEEQHSQTSVALVLSGTFQYCTSTGHELMSPGSLLLGNSGDLFSCGHEHSVGDRCVSFHYSDELCDELSHAGRRRFHIPRIPALRALSPLTARLESLVAGAPDHAILEEVAFQVLDRAVHLQHGLTSRRRVADPSSLARVTRVLRGLEAEPEALHELSTLAAEARLSVYHFLRCFEDLTGTTPHQYLLRLRLRRAAVQLKQTSGKILDVALDCGFGDVSNFNRAFRAEFGVSPRAYRRSG